VLQDANLIVVVSAGEVVEKGTHEALISNPDGEYIYLPGLNFLLLWLIKHVATSPSA
jgi:ABC-type proline/glycine betaine transport system ATPase subunit